MKSNRLFSLSLAMLTALTLGLTSCAEPPQTGESSSIANSQSGSSDNNSQTSTDSKPEAPKTIKKLIVSRDPDKILYEAGEKFDPTGLRISIIELLDGAKISETVTQDYVLMSNGEELTEETVVNEGELEIIVKSKTDGVRSTSFTVTAIITKQLQTLDAVFDEILTNNNFTVVNNIGAENIVTGLVNDDAIYWKSNDKGYFSDVGYGYSTLEGHTFRFKIEDGSFKDAQYIKDLGPKAIDDGLWSSETYDEHADVRISNYNMRSLDKKELDDTREYLKTVKPVEGNANKYMLDIKYVKWLFNLIGHRQLCLSPAFLLKDNKGEVYVEVKNNGLHVELVKKASYAIFDNCSADITRIGTTTIPGKRAFFLDPKFGITKTSIDLLGDALMKRNYSFKSTNQAKSATFNADYVYGLFLENNQDINFNGLKVKENNTIKKEPGFYEITIKNNQVTLGEMVNDMDIPYLTNYLIMTKLKEFFKKTGDNANHYEYVPTQETEALSQLLDLLKIYSNATDETVISGASLDIVMNEDNSQVLKATFTFKHAGGQLEGFTLEDFGKAKNNVIETYIASIY